MRPIAKVFCVVHIRDLLEKIKWTTSSEKKCLRTCAKWAFREFCSCAKYHPGLCSPFIHCLVSSDSVRGQWMPDQTAQISRLIWALAIHICAKTRFRMAWSKYSKKSLALRSLILKFILDMGNLFSSWASKVKDLLINIRLLWCVVKQKCWR